MTPDPFGHAIRDHYLGEREERLIDRDGTETREHKIEEWYFGDHQDDAWRDAWMDGPLIDLGAGVGRDALYYQEQFETVAIEAIEPLVKTMQDRGVADARLADMFSLTQFFDRDRFRSAQAIGTQVGLAGSMAGVREFLADLAYVTTPGAAAVLDNYDPHTAAAEDVFAYRADPTPGLGVRVYHEEYEGEVGPTLLFRVFGVDRLWEATLGTPWTVAKVSFRGDQWRALLQKDSPNPGRGTSE